MSPEKQQQRYSKMGIVLYLLTSIFAAIFCFWFWDWGVQQGAVSSIEEVPGIFSISNIIASILFFSSGWLVLHKGFQDKKISFIVLIGIIIWYLAVVILGMMGFFALRPLFAPNIGFAFIILLFAIKKILSIKALQAAFDAVPLNLIMLVQTFRVMGVGFLSLYAMKVLPPQFAIPTGLGDVFVGITAPIVAYIYTLQKPFSKQIAIIWNYLGIADLAMSITLGILTYPEPLNVISTQVSNLPIALYPLVIIPVFAVPFSLLIHLFTLRRLLMRSATE